MIGVPHFAKHIRGTEGAVKALQEQPISTRWLCPSLLLRDCARLEIGVERALDGVSLRRFRVEGRRGSLRLLPDAAERQAERIPSPFALEDVADVMRYDALLKA